MIFSNRLVGKSSHLSSLKGNKKKITVFNKKYVFDLRVVSLTGYLLREHEK